MINNNNSLEDFSEDVGNLVKSNLELNKLELIERFSIISTSVLSNFIIGISFLFFMLFGSVAAFIYISIYFNDYTLGSAIVGAFYLVLSMVLFMGKRTMLQNPIRNKIIRSIFSA
ncbi:MAG: phage holin family protein [bacterium]|nr:phage holin family protein [bacterium]